MLGVSLDFSLRRTHGLEPGFRVARSSWLAGFDATSDVLAGRLASIRLDSGDLLELSRRGRAISTRPDSRT